MALDEEKMDILMNSESFEEEMALAEEIIRENYEILEKLAQQD